MSSGIRIASRVAMAGALGVLALGGCSAPNEPPEVRITAPSEDRRQGSELTFEANIDDPDGEIATVMWRFGDGTTSTEPSPTHTYTQSGEYRVEVTVTDEDGATATDGVTIRVQRGPSATASIQDPNSPRDVLLQYASGQAPLTVRVDGSRSEPEPGAEIARAEWAFGDGTEASGLTAEHTYEEPGTFRATLTVTGSRGQTDTDEIVVEVEAAEDRARGGEVRLGERIVGYDPAAEPATRNSPSGISAFHSYVLETDARLSRAQIRRALEAILTDVKASSDADWLHIRLFNADRESFMVPRDYDHYLGSITWERGSSTDNSQESPTIAVNTAYLSGDAVSVLGTRVESDRVTPDHERCGELCRRYRIGVASLYVQDEPRCRERVTRTVRELAEWRLRAEYAGFLATIYGRNVQEPIGWALGTRAEDGPALEELPLGLFETPPERWDITTDTLRLRLQDLGTCPGQSQPAGEASP